MGLSDEERLSKIVWAVNRLNELNSELTGALEEEYSFIREKYQKVQSLVDTTWHALFGNETNGLHWFMGSGSNDTITTNSPASPWELATTQQLEWRLPLPEGYVRLPDESRIFNAFDCFLNISGLLNCYPAKAESVLFKMYEWLEEISYALRRYNDKFKNNYKTLDTILSSLYGECYSIFSKQQVFQQAYLAHEILKILYSDKYPYKKNEDIVVSILDEHNLHHDSGKIVCLPLEELSKTHKELVKLVVLAKHRDDKNWQENYLLLEGRCIALFELAPKGCFGHKHIKDKIFDSISSSVLKKSLPKLQNKAKECEKKIDKEDEKLYKKDDLVDCLNAYGYHGNSEMYEYLKELKKEEDKGSKKTKIVTSPKKKSVKRKISRQ